MVRNKWLPYWYPVVIFVVSGILSVLVWINATHFPRALTRNDEPSHADRFIAERARNTTVRLANLGPKVTGSPAAAQAKLLMLQQIDEIRTITNPAHRLEVSVQTASGSFSIRGMTSVYTDIQNVVVRLSPSAYTAPHTLLLNSHYDSVPISDGAGDDTFMVAVMLEVLRVLATSPETHQHAIVFLFNGAEETGLQGAHAFVQQPHEWAAQVGAFINLDSCGSGGRDLLFQLSSGAGWLMRTYGRAVPHAFASVALQELFESGIIPSDTDFRIFRDFGGLVGVDIALTNNGFVYHTSRDRPEIIEIGSYQNVGDNVLALTRALADSDELAAAALGTSAENDEDMVFFDFLGWFLVSYTMTQATIINSCVSGAVLVLVLLMLHSYARKSEISYFMMLAELTFIFVVQLVAVVVSGLLAVGAGSLYDAVGYSMSYYSNVWLTTGLFAVPMLIGLLAGPVFYLQFYQRLLRKALHQYKDFDNTMTVVRQSYHVQLFMHAHALVCVVALIALTALGVRSAYLLAVGLVFYGVTTLVNYALRLHVCDSRWMYVHFVGQIAPFVLHLNMMIAQLPTLASIQGRSGPASNPDLAIAIVVFGFGLLMSGFLVPTICLVRRPIWWLGGLVVVWIVATILVFTPIGFPYRERTSEQRFWIFHSDRTFHKLHDIESYTDHGYLSLGMDRHTNRYVNDIVPGLKDASDAAQLCDSHLLCGLPYYSSKLKSHDDVWLPVNHTAIAPADRTTLQLVSNEPMLGDIRRYTFDLSGPDHLNLYMSPAIDSHLIDWSFAKPDFFYWNERKVYFLFLGNGDATSSRHTTRFHIDIENKSRLDASLSFDIAIAGHHVHRRDLFNPEFERFLRTFPAWAHVTSWISSYESWQY